MKKGVLLQDIARDPSIILLNLGFMPRVGAAGPRSIPDCRVAKGQMMSPAKLSIRPDERQPIRVGVQFFHDQVCRTELGPKFGPVARHRDSKYSCVLFSTPLITYVLQR